MSSPSAIDAGREPQVKNEEDRRADARSSNVGDVTRSSGGVRPKDEQGEGRGAVKEDDDEEEEEEEEDDDEDDDEDEEDDEEEEDEDDEDDERGERERGGRRRKRRRQGVSRFVDVEAVVDDDEEEYDEEDNELLREDGFIEQDAGVDDDDFQRRTAADNQMLDRQRRREEELDAEQIAAQLNERYRNQRGLTAQSDYEEVPQTLLMPSVNDPGLYSVRVRPGRERIVIQTLLRKAFNPGTSAPLKIISAFSRDSIPGRIYVEATEPKHVIDACADVASAFARDNTLFLVPINEMADLLKITKTRQELKPGGWVRFKSGKHAGDLAQVIDTSENGETVGVRFVPRLDLDPREDDVVVDKQGRKRKKAGRAAAERPPPRFFNYEEVRKKFRSEAVSRRDAVTYVFRNQTYVKGYCEDDIPVRRLVTENVNPTLDEISRFTGDLLNGSTTENDANGVNLSLLADAAKRKADIVLRKDDHVVVSEGEQSGVEGVIETVEADVVTIRVTLADLDDQTIEVPIQAVRKKFRPGDHIKVIAGKHRDETGLVVKVEDNVTTFLSDLSLQEVAVFSNDIHEAAEVGSGVNTIGGYELHNLVQLDAQTAGVIFKIEREVFMILDQANAVRPIRPHQITMKRDSSRAVGVDSEGGEFRTGDTMKEIDGEEREGVVLHVYLTTLVWLFNRDIKENGGVFLARTRQLRPRAPRGMVKPDLSKMNPSIAAAAGQSAPAGGAISNMRRPGGRDPLAGKTVSIIRGPYKTYRGIIKDTNGPSARVELHSISKVLTIGLDQLIEKDPYTGKSKPLLQRNPASAPRPGATTGGYGGLAQNPYVSGGSSRTPAHNPYVSGGRTPAYGAGGRTPGYNPYVDGGKTPAYNPYVDGGKTPAYNPYGDGGKTPAYQSYNDGGKTPAYTPYGGGGGGGSSSSSNMAPPTLRRPADFSAPTPMGAPTPGDFSAPTPGAYAAPTPGAYAAPTPGGAYAAPTPGGLGAPTPGGGMLGAPTPAAYGQVAHTPATHGRNFAGSSVERTPPSLLAGILVRIVPSTVTGSSMFSGKYDGKTGYIKAIKQGGESATIVLDENAWDASSGSTLENVGKEFVSPIHPTSSKAVCLALIGEHRGKRVVVQSLDGEQVLGLVEGRTAFFDVEHLACAS